MEKISLNDRVKNEEVLHRVEEWNSQQTIKRWNANCIGHTLRRHCLPKHVIERKTKETRISERRKKTQAVSIWPFGKGYGPVARHTTAGDDEVQWSNKTSHTVSTVCKICVNYIQCPTIMLWRPATHMLRRMVLDSIPKWHTIYVGQLWTFLYIPVCGFPFAFFFFGKSSHEKNINPEI